MLALNAPGQLSYDSVTQLAEGRAGHYNSWHPPLMAFLLGLFDRLVPGTLLFLLFQSLLLLGGLLGLLALKPRGWLSAVVALLIVLSPQWLLYQGEIWKDMLFADAAIAGFAALAWHARQPRLWIALLALVLLVLAASVRQNGIVLLPVAAAVFAFSGRWRQGLLFLAASLALLAGVAAAFARRPGLQLPLPADLDRLLKGPGARLYTPLRSDPFAAEPVISRARADAEDGTISHAWMQLVTRYPLLYLSVRWDDFAAVLTTPDTEVCHLAMIGVTGPPDLMRRLALTPRDRAQDRALKSYARLFFATPIFSHIAWGLLAVLLLVVLLRRGAPADRAVAALLAAALLFSASFFFISLACDYRYLIFLDLAAMAALLYAIAKG